MSNLFGINGVRGVVNETLTSDVALRLGRAIGRFYNGPEIGRASCRERVLW